jgi:hypothetical protein
MKPTQILSLSAGHVEYDFDSGPLHTLIVQVVPKPVACGYAHGRGDTLEKAMRRLRWEVLFAGLEWDGIAPWLRIDPTAPRSARKERHRDSRTKLEDELTLVAVHHPVTDAIGRVAYRVGFTILAGFLPAGALAGIVALGILIF